MKFGKSVKEKKKEKYNREHRPKEKWFCWHPVILEDGRAAWMEVVNRHTIPTPNLLRNGTTHKWLYTAKD
jgi:hypothetical protein